MKINYQTLKTFSAEKLTEGFHIFLANAERLSQLGDSLALSKDYGVATVLKILSIEEAVKANSIFFVWLGVEKEDLINSAFKGDPKAQEGVHQRRLNLAAFNNKIHNLVLPELQEKIEQHLKGKMEHVEANLQTDFNRFLNEVVNDLPIKHSLIDIPKLEIELGLFHEQKASTLFSAQAIKEDCLYAGLNNNHEWIDPLKTKMETFVNAKEESDDYLSYMYKIREVLSSTNLNKEFFKMLVLKCYI